MSRSADKPSHRSSLKKSKDLASAATRILTLLRASPTRPPSERDLTSELNKNIKSARAALAVAKVILPHWTILWLLVETAMKDEHLAIVIKWLEKLWDVVEQKKSEGRRDEGHYYGGEEMERGSDRGSERGARRERRHKDAGSERGYESDERAQHRRSERRRERHEEWR